MNGREREKEGRVSKREREREREREAFQTSLLYYKREKENESTKKGW